MYRKRWLRQLVQHDATKRNVILLLHQDMLIRRIAEADAEAIYKLSEQLGYSISIEETQENIRQINLNPAHIAFVALIHDKIIGWIHLQQTLYLESPSFVEIVGLIIDKKQRRHGIGKQLVQHAINWAGEKHSFTVRVRSNIKRKESHDFYKAIGFVEIKEQKVYELINK